MTRTITISVEDLKIIQRALEVFYYGAKDGILLEDIIEDTILNVDENSLSDFTH